MERLAVQPCLSGQLKALATKLSAFRGDLWQGVPMIVNQKTDRDAQQRAVIAAYRAPERLWVSEAWQTLTITSTPRSPRMVPLAAFLESVGPSNSRTRAIAPSPSRAMAITGVFCMNFWTSGKNGFDAM